MMLAVCSNSCLTVERLRKKPNWELEMVESTKKSTTLLKNQFLKNLGDRRQQRYWSVVRNKCFIP